MILKFTNYSLLVFFSLLLYSCTNNSFDVKLEEDVEVKEIRFDQELMQIDTSKIEESIDLFYQKYPVFFPTYTYGVIKIGGRETKTFSKELKRFVSNITMREVNAEIQKQYKDISDVTDEINKSLSYYHYYFPEEPIPNLYYMQSGFNQKIIVDSLVLGVALDMCLGADNDYYKQLALPAYMRKKLNKENIAVDAMRGMAWSNFVFDAEDNVACNMIYEGKIQYFIDALFPDKTEAQKLSYSEEDLKWLNIHEEEIWNAVIEGDMLYQTDRMKIKNMIDNAPFTQAFGNTSPSKIGVWLGWNIVKSYMQEHPEITLPDLMMNKDYIRILNESNYTP